MSNSKTFYLYARPSFIEGMSRLFDFGGTLQEYNEHESGDVADYEAIKRDWQAIGGDIFKSLKEYEQTHFTQGKF
jgi:DNA modification methylase